MPCECQHLGQLLRTGVARRAGGHGRRAMPNFGLCRRAASQVAAQLRRLRSFCKLLERAVSLAINGANAKVVVMTVEAAAAARRESRLVGPPLSGMVVVSSARYLGFMVMAEGSEAWEPVGATGRQDGVPHQVGQVVGWGSMVSRVRRFSMYCMPILRYWAHA